MTLAVETIRTAEGLDAIRDAWEALRLADPERSPFLAYEWFRCCLEDPEGASLRVLVVRDGDRLLGIAPLASRVERGRWGRWRSIGFIRCRETPFADLIVVPERRPEVVEALFRHLLRDARDAWDLLRLGPWPERSANYAAARDALRALGARTEERTASVVPVVPIDRDWEAFWGTRTYQFRKSRRGILNRIAKAGTVTVESVTRDESGEGLRALFHVADRAWKREEGIAITSRPESRRFFEALTEAAGKRGWLLLWILRLDGAPIAVEYDLAEGGVVHALRADFDQERRQHSPGALLEYHLLHRLFDEAYRAYCAGPGFDAYKLRWTEEVRRNMTLTVYNAGALPTLLWATEERLVPLARRLRDRLSGARPGAAGDAPEDGA